MENCILFLLTLFSPHKLLTSSLRKVMSPYWGIYDVTWDSLIAHLVKELPAMRRPWFNSCVRKICWRRDRLPTPEFLGFPGSLAGKESACNVGDMGLIPALGRSPGEGNSYPLQCSGLENSMDFIVHRVSKSRTRLGDFHFHFGRHTWSSATCQGLVHSPSTR